jgi:hypothetical protein
MQSSKNPIPEINHSEGDSCGTDGKTALEIEGWNIHVIYPGCGFPNHFCAMTEGFEITFNHPEIQMVIPMRPDWIHAMFMEVAACLKSGHTISTGENDFYLDIMPQPYAVRFIEKQYNGKTVLRMLCPDKNNTFEEEGFNNQFL